MKVKEYMRQCPMNFNHGTGVIKSDRIPSLNKIIVKGAKLSEFKDCSNIRIGIELIPECSIGAIRYGVRDTEKAKAIANFIDKNKGKRLLDVLEMDLP